ncbi:MAG TPA: response regulator [Anaerolineales bacterium]|nr:response regulator [Anaerolineales bacterium]
MLSDQTQLSKIRILLADDHHRVREQLSARLSRETDFEVAGVTSTSRATLHETRAKHPHILLIDPFMRDGLGLATLRQVRVSFPELVIVVLTAYVDTALKMQFQQMGIRYILTKGSALSHLITELRTAYRSSYFS